MPVEVADTQEEREVGLMNRESLPADAGMIFVFEEDTGGFWMKDTLIPLSIAFAAADGTIVSILDMDPCEADPCEIYDPGVPYGTRSRSTRARSTTGAPPSATCSRLQQ